MRPVFYNFPMVSIVLSLVCAVVSSVLRGRAARTLSLFLCTAVAVLSACTLGYTVSCGEELTYVMGQFPAPWGNEIRFGIVEPLICLSFSIVLLLCIVGGKKQLHNDIDAGKANLYYVMIDLVQAALLALSYTNDIFTAFVFVEICTISSSGLLMIRGLGRTTLASIRYLVFSLVGSGLFLIGCVLIYGVTGHLLMPFVKEQIAALWTSGQYRLPLLMIIGLITMGLAVKSGMWPFHFWMPDTYSYTTPASSGILSGLISKIYILLLLRFVFCVFGTDVFYATGIASVLFLCGLAGMLFGSLRAIRENHIMRMLAFSSAAQIGYIYMGIGLSPALGVAAAVLHILCHAVTKPPLFLAAAELKEAAGGSARFADLQGAAYRAPMSAAVFLVGSLSMVGIPFFFGFITKFRFAAASVAGGGWMMLPALVMLAVSTVLNTMYLLRTVLRIFSTKLEPEEHGPAREAGEPPMAPEPTPHLHSGACFAGAAGAFCVLNVVLGVCTQPLWELLVRGLQLL